jgi:hypothetical protein
MVGGDNDQRVVRICHLVSLLDRARELDRLSECSEGVAGMMGVIDAAPSSELTIA